MPESREPSTAERISCVLLGSIIGGLFFNLLVAVELLLATPELAIAGRRMMAAACAGPLAGGVFGWALSETRQAELKDVFYTLAYSCGIASLTYALSAAVVFVRFGAEAKLPGSGLTIGALLGAILSQWPSMRDTKVTRARRLVASAGSAMYGTLLLGVLSWSGQGILFPGDAVLLAVQGGMIGMCSGAILGWRGWLYRHDRLSKTLLDSLLAGAAISLPCVAAATWVARTAALDEGQALVHGLAIAALAGWAVSRKHPILARQHDSTTTVLNVLRDSAIFSATSTALFSVPIWLATTSLSAALVAGCVGAVVGCWYGSIVGWSADTTYQHNLLQLCVRYTPAMAFTGLVGGGIGRFLAWALGGDIVLFTATGAAVGVVPGYALADEAGAPDANRQLRLILIHIFFNAVLLAVPTAAVVWTVCHLFSWDTDASVTWTTAFAGSAGAWHGSVEGLRIRHDRKEGFLDTIAGAFGGVPYFSLPWCLFWWLRGLSPTEGAVIGAALGVFVGGFIGWSQPEALRQRMPHRATALSDAFFWAILFLLFGAVLGAVLGILFEWDTLFVPLYLATIGGCFGFVVGYAAWYFPDLDSLPSVDAAIEPAQRPCDLKAPALAYHVPRLSRRLPDRFVYVIAAYGPHLPFILLYIAFVGGISLTEPPPTYVIVLVVLLLAAPYVLRFASSLLPLVPHLPGHIACYLHRRIRSNLEFYIELGPLLVGFTAGAAVLTLAAVYRGSVLAFANALIVLVAMRLIARYASSWLLTGSTSVRHAPSSPVFAYVFWCCMLYLYVTMFPDVAPGATLAAIVLHFRAEHNSLSHLQAFEHFRISRSSEPLQGFNPDRQRTTTDNDYGQSVAAICDLDLPAELRISLLRDLHEKLARTERLQENAHPSQA